MGYRHRRDDVLAAAVAVAEDSGLGELTFRSVGRRMGIPDRTVVYYFPTKGQLVLAVLQHSSEQLVRLLSAAVHDGPHPPDELLRAAWTALRRPEARRPLQIYVEVLGLAVRGGEPYRSIVVDLAATWVAWFGPRLAVDAADRDDRAAALVATLDGLLLLLVTSGPDLADAAARGLHPPRIPPDPSGRPRPEGPDRRAARPAGGR